MTQPTFQALDREAELETPYNHGVNYFIAHARDNGGSDDEVCMASLICMLSDSDSRTPEIVAWFAARGVVA
jgi:hypothetical protein